MLMNAHFFSPYAKAPALIASMQKNKTQTKNPQPIQFSLCVPRKEKKATRACCLPKISPDRLK